MITWLIGKSLVPAVGKPNIAHHKCSLFWSHFTIAIAIVPTITVCSVAAQDLIMLCQGRTLQHLQQQPRCYAAWVIFFPKGVGHGIASPSRKIFRGLLESDEVCLIYV